MGCGAVVLFCWISQFFVFREATSRNERGTCQSLRYVISKKEITLRMKHRNHYPRYSNNLSFPRRSITRWRKCTRNKPASESLKCLYWETSCSKGSSWQPVQCMVVSWPCLVKTVSTLIFQKTSGWVSIIFHCDIKLIFLKKRIKYRVWLFLGQKWDIYFVT